ncbi:ABC transporter permease protein NatB [Pseudoalteromonas holothuriae]|uniref:ABC transporter permease protein NatB n=1 Tax=Pseudoalteromonas holothuriae TaxID=2963714 RepID=A0A9W4W194_9GAMM|nr:MULTISPECIES: ABC transporter permease [unclassified Pseudoalteromonas]CAH9061717.1 ABC transporter permease protein NatB [Pseudoalteromonas sp. CIP111951]CAH9062005.1 ABC transporter permease protein NatB [Pseudoalteromonas sp. CIP111854]
MFEVFKKELLELLRDRKTLFFVLALPMLIFPVIMGLVGFLGSQAALKAEQKVHTYYIINAQHSKQFAERVFYHKSFKQYSGAEQFDTIDALKEAVRSGSIDVGIYLEADPADALKQGKQAKWQMVFNDAQSINFIYNRLQSLANEFSELLREQALVSLGVSKDKQQAILQPIVVSKVDTADKRENIGEKIGAFIPYLLIPLVLMGASYPAIDLGAGEKERGTLETLLLTPVTRTQLVLGKFLTVLLSSLACATVTVLSMAIWVSVAVSFVELDTIKNAFSSITGMDFVLIFALLVPIAAIFSSLVLAISIYARTFKEAQNYMAPLSMGVFLPIVVSLMPNMVLNAKTALIPVTNVALAIKEIVKGTVDYGLLSMIVITSAGLAALLLACCVRWFSKETVLFR